MLYRLTSQLPTSNDSVEVSRELNILRRAISSNGRGVSIRTLFEQIPHILAKLSPCMLMSPISVAQYLKAENDQMCIRDRYTGRVRKYAKEQPVAEAVERAITECIQEGILKEFLEKNRREAKNVSIYEYDQEKHIRQEREEAWEDGEKAGRTNHLREQIRKKLAKGKTLSLIHI